MQEKNIDEIIRLVLTGEATREETSSLHKWLLESEENRQVFYQVQTVWNERSPEPRLRQAEQISERIWAKALQTEDIPLYAQEKNHTFPWAYYIKTAAIILLVIGLPLLLFTYTSVKEPAKVEASLVEKKSTIGQKLKVTLPDGSLAWLNADSKITYADNFTGNSRMIELEGEGFFEVKKDAEKPFVVISGKIITTAIGTSFNISAYPDDSTTQVALITGKVEVKSPQTGKREEVFTLHKGNGVNYHKHLNQADKYLFDEQAVLAWKQGILAFEGDSFKGVKSKIRRWYGVEVSVTGLPPDDWKLTGRFKNEPLPSVLENIRFGRNFSYQIAGKHLNFHFETPKP